MALPIGRTKALLAEQRDIKKQLSRIDAEVGDLHRQQRRHRNRLRVVKALLDGPKSAADVLAESGDVLHGGVHDAAH